MARSISALFLSLVLALSGLLLAGARGQNPDLGMEIVICSGVGMTTISLGPDGQPVEETHVCPDGASIFAASFSLPALERPEARLIAQMPAVRAVRFVAQHEISASARGPPSLV